MQVPQFCLAILFVANVCQVHSYFRAIQRRNETSVRALHLTADVIEHNSANYTAWYYRRRCLKELGIDLEEERIFTDKWARDCPKNYQAGCNILGRVIFFRYAGVVPQALARDRDGHACALSCPWA